MSAHRVTKALVVVAILLCLSALAFGQESRARIVRLSYIDGDARIDQGSQQGEQRAILNMPVVQGTRLMAEDDSRVEVEFENGSTMRLVGPAEVIFRELSLRGDGDKVTLVEVTNGLVYFDVTEKDKDDFRVDVQNHDLKVRKSSHFRVDGSATAPKLAVFKGELQLLDAPKEVTVKKGDTITFDAGDPAHYALAKELDPLGADVWDHDRAQDRETYARSQAYKNSLSYAGSPYNYGMYDLSYYGNWFSGPGGPCWRPSGYGFGWDPFSQGAWNYYPGSGWVFVSYYPWGWTPYRYGSWNWFGGTGWCWSPGGYYGWNPYPIIVTQPPQFQPPRPPTKPPGPPVFIGGRKIPPTRWPLPERYAGKPPVGPPQERKELPPVVGAPGNPTGLRAPGPPAERDSYMDGARRTGGPTGNPQPGAPSPKGQPQVTPPAPMPRGNDAQRPTPPAPRVETPRPAPMPTPHVDSTPRYSPPPSPPPAPAPAPAPAPHVESAKPH